MRGFLLCALLVSVLGVAKPPCEPPAATSCAPCHEKNLSSVYPARAPRPCAPYCLSCHFQGKPERHHPVGQQMRSKPLNPALHLEGNRLSCATCHDVSRPALDSRRWKAASYFERMFRPKPQHRTYFLVSPNDQGQLCKACH